jgi:hypothetical protein
MSSFFLRDNDFANRRWVAMPAASALGVSVIRATSAPSVVAATTNADRPRSTPTQPLATWLGGIGWCRLGCSSAASTFRAIHQRPAW